MVLNAKIPSWLESAMAKQQQQQQQQSTVGGGQSTQQQSHHSTPISNHSASTSTLAPAGANNNSPQTQEWLELWEKFDQRGILHDRLLDVLWKNVMNQKPGLLGLMKKFDLICERSFTTSSANSAPSLVSPGGGGGGTGGGSPGIGIGPKYAGSEHHLNREYLVPSRAKIVYDQEESVAELLGESLSMSATTKTNGNHHRRNHYDDDDDDDDDNDDDNDSDNSDYYDSPGHHRGSGYDDSGEVSSDGYFRTAATRNGGTNNKTRKNRILNNDLNVEFYYDFCGFLSGRNFSLQTLTYDFI